MTTNRPRKITYKVQTQLVSIHRPDGARINYARKGKWRNWAKQRTRLENVRDAINFVNRILVNTTPSKRGGIVVIRTVVNGHSLRDYTKIYEAKWGTDDIPYTAFSQVAGDYWRRQLLVK